jgi:hypothetical protein
MSQQGPIIIVSTAQRPSFASALDDAKIFPIIDTGWADASRAIEQLQPAAVLVATSDAVDADVETLAKRIAARQPYLPLLVIDPGIRLPENAIPLSQASGNFERLIARLRAALRVRSLHATVMRRLEDPAARKTLADIDPARDATVLLIGRGAAYPALSVSLGERMGVVGALLSKPRRNTLTRATSTGSCSAKVLARAWWTPFSRCWRRTRVFATCLSS